MCHNVESKWVCTLRLQRLMGFWYSKEFWSHACMHACSIQTTEDVENMEILPKACK